MGDYQALVAYFGVTLVVFAGGLLWHKYRSFAKKRFRLINYRETDVENSKTTHNRA